MRDDKPLTPQIAVNVMRSCTVTFRAMQPALRDMVKTLEHTATAFTPIAQDIARFNKMVRRDAREQAEKELASRRARRRALVASGIAHLFPE